VIGDQPCLNWVQINGQGYALRLWHFFALQKKSVRSKKKAVRCEAAQAEKQKKKKTFLSVFEVLQT
jgi:hypothetical protein